MPKYNEETRRKGRERKNAEGRRARLLTDARMDERIVVRVDARSMIELWSSI